MEIWNDGKMRVKECFTLLGPLTLKEHVESSPLEQDEMSCM
jgi:hypothetical protein